MIAAMLAAPTREDFVAAVRALDRILISGTYVVPLFYLPEQWIAHWTRIEHPARPALLRLFAADMVGQGAVGNAVWITRSTAPDGSRGPWRSVRRPDLPPRARRSGSCRFAGRAALDPVAIGGNGRTEGDQRIGRDQDRRAADTEAGDAFAAEIDQTVGADRHGGRAGGAHHAECMSAESAGAPEADHCSAAWRTP